MKEILDKKYYYEFKGGHYFLIGLGFQISLENKEVVEDAIRILQETYGLDEPTFTERVEFHNKIKKIDNKIEQMKLLEKYNPIQIIKILNTIK